MLVGYCRTSTVEQEAGFQAQHRLLGATGCTKIFAEQVSSVGQRDQLDAALEFLREGDTLVVCKLDRLARSTSHLLAIVAVLDRKNVGLRILDFGGSAVDTGSPSGRLMLTMFSAIGQFEREMMLERQKEGITAAKAAGKYKGRAATARANPPACSRSRNRARAQATLRVSSASAGRRSIAFLRMPRPSNGRHPASAITSFYDPMTYMRSHYREGRMALDVDLSTIGSLSRTRRTNLRRRALDLFNEARDVLEALDDALEHDFALATAGRPLEENRQKVVTAFQSTPATATEIAVLQILRGNPRRTSSELSGLLGWEGQS